MKRSSSRRSDKSGNYDDGAAHKNLLYYGTLPIRLTLCYWTLVLLGLERIPCCRPLRGDHARFDGRRTFHA